MNKKGFTLVEIMIVVLIISILSAFLLLNMSKVRIEANHTNAKATLSTLSKAFETYYVSNGTYPNDTTLLVIATPKYLSKDYFDGVYRGYVFTSVLSDYSYIIVATPIGVNMGTKTFTMSTGAVLSEF